jgi:hypothetical protein
MLFIGLRQTPSLIQDVSLRKQPRLRLVHPGLRHCMLTVAFPRRGPSITNSFSSGRLALACRQIRWAPTIHLASLEIQVDPLVSASSTRPCTVARSVWWEDAATLALLDPPLSEKNLVFLALRPVRTGQNTPSVIRTAWHKCARTPIRHQDRMV